MKAFTCEKWKSFWKCYVNSYAAAGFKQNYFEKFETLWIHLFLITGAEEIYIFTHRKAKGSTKGIRNVSSSSPFGIGIKIYLKFSADLPLLTASHSETKQMLKVEDEKNK